MNCLERDEERDARRKYGGNATSLDDEGGPLWWWWCTAEVILDSIRDGGWGVEEWAIIGLLFLCCCCCCAGCALATRRTLRRRVQARARKLVASASSAFMHGSGKRLSVGAVTVSIGETSSTGNSGGERRSCVTVPTDYKGSKPKSPGSMPVPPPPPKAAKAVPPPPKPPPPKPVVTWTEFYDEAVGARYYASNTGETTWDRPTTGVVRADSSAQRANQADAASSFRDSSCTLAV